jgi:hypothetical protein
MGIQKTDEYAPHGLKSCGSCQRSSVPKNNARQIPSVVAEPGLKKNSFQYRLALVTA